MNSDCIYHIETLPICLLGVNEGSEFKYSTEIQFKLKFDPNNYRVATLPLFCHFFSHPPAKLFETPAFWKLVL